MNFHIGQKVVCIDDVPPRHIVGTPADIHKGAIYTVIATGLTNSSDPDRLPCIKVAESKTPGPIWAHRFRPVIERKTDISIFTEMLKPKSRELVTEQ